MDRAQFLQNLRTAGPRSASFGNPPLSANPTTARFASNTFQPQYEDLSSQLVDRFGNMSMGGGLPMSAGPESAVNARLQQAQQQQQQLIMMQAQAQVAAMLASQGGGHAIEAQAMQMQMEVMRLQALQQQQNFQTQLMLQSQLVQQQADQTRRLSELHQVPSTAGPLTSSFPDTTAAQTRSNAANQLRARAAGREASLRASVSEEQIAVNPPMTAAVGGKFSARTVSSPLNPNAAAFVGKFNPELSLAIAAATKLPATGEANTPATPTYGATTVISGGTPLGSNGPGSTSPGLTSTPSNSYNGLSGYSNSAATGPTKSDSASSWRRGSSATPGNTPVQTSPTFGLPKAPSPPLRNRSVSPPGMSSKLNLSTSNSESNDSIVSPLRIRPSPLRFTTPSGESIAIARSGSPSGSADGNGSFNDGASPKSSPTSSTPPSSAGSAGLGKEREEASKKLYEGLGIGRPAPSPVSMSFNPNAVPFVLNTSLPMFTTTAPTPNALTPITQAPAPVVFGKVEPIRQPMGPPCSVDELGPMNFASRLRKKALGGLMDARERRENFAAAAMAQEMAAY